MDDFDKLFFVVKNECEKQKNIAEIYNFEAVAKEAKIPINKLESHLDHLKELGLIKYSMSEKYISLTSLGKKQKSRI